MNYPYYTYRIDFADGCYYYGQKKRKDDTPPEQDGYYGSPVTHKQKWIDHICCKTILFVHENAEEAGTTECLLIGDRHRTDPKCLNAHDGATYSPRKHNDETKRKIGKANKGKRTGKPAHNKGVPHTEETKRKISEASKGRPAHNKGVPRTEEEKQKISEARKGIPSNKKGVPVSEEQKRKQREKMKGRQSPRKGVKLSEETKRKLSESKKRYYARLRQEKAQANITP